MNLDLIPQPVKIWSQFFHPALMWVLLALTLYALYLGIKSKRTRQAEGEAKKELIKGKYSVRHHQIGAIVLALMVTGTIGGMAVTYINNQKLFVGPHLLVGLGMTAMIATSAAMTPFMQKGATWARLIHVGLNMSLVTLFGWQAVTGLDIVQRIISKL